jgi:hypothetical protein
MSRVAFKVSSSTCITRCPSTELKVFSMGASRGSARRAPELVGRRAGNRPGQAVALLLCPAVGPSGSTGLAAVRICPSLSDQEPTGMEWQQRRPICQFGRWVLRLSRAWLRPRRLGRWTSRLSYTEGVASAATGPLHGCYWWRRSSWSPLCSSPLGRLHVMGGPRQARQCCSRRSAH